MRRQGIRVYNTRRNAKARAMGGVGCAYSCIAAATTEPRGSAVASASPLHLAVTCRAAKAATAVAAFRYFISSRRAQFSLNSKSRSELPQAPPAVAVAVFRYFVKSCRAQPCLGSSCGRAVFRESASAGIREQVAVLEVVRLECRGFGGESEGGGG